MFEKFEKDVIEFFLQNASNLHCKIDDLQIEKREFSGDGFFTYFRGNVEDSDTHISNAGALLNEKIQVGFTLFVNKGKLNFLEGYTYCEPWPEHIETYKIFTT